MRTRNKWLAVALVVAMALPITATTASATKDPPPPSTATATTAAVSSGSVGTRTGTAIYAPPGQKCWRGQTNHASYNGSYTKYNATMTVEWCAQNGVVIAGTRLICGNQGGYYTYLRCTPVAGMAGVSTRYTTTDWDYSFGAGWATLNFDVDLVMYLTATGAYYGTWYWNG